MIGQLRCAKCLNRSFKALTRTTDKNGQRKVKLAALVCTKCNELYELNNGAEVTNDIEAEPHSTRLQ